MNTNPIIKRICILSMCGVLACSAYGCRKTGKEDAAARGPEEMVIEISPELKTSQIRQFQVDEKGTTKYKFDFRKRTDRERFLYWDMTVPYGSIAIVDSEAMYQLYENVLGILEGHSKNQFVNTKDGADMSQYGIEDSGIKITIGYVSDESATSDATVADKKAVLLVGKDNQEGQYYCAMEGAEDKIFLVDTYKIDAVRNKKPFDMILKIPYLVNINSVKQVTIKLEEKKIQMANAKGSYKINGKQVTEDQYKKLYASLLQPSITGSYKEGMKEGNQIVSMEYKRTKKEYEPYKVRILSANEKEDIIEVNGKRYFMIDKGEVESLVEVVKEYS